MAEETKHHGDFCSGLNVSTVPSLLLKDFTSNNYFYRGSIVSLLRVIFSYISISRRWNAEFSLFIQAILGLAEVGIVVICACLPVTRPLFVKIGQFVPKAISSIRDKANSCSKRLGSKTISLGSQGYNDNEPIRLDDVSHRRDYSIVIEEINSTAGYLDSHLEVKSNATVTGGKH